MTCTTVCLPRSFNKLLVFTAIHIESAAEAIFKSEVTHNLDAPLEYILYSYILLHKSTKHNNDLKDFSAALPLHQ